MSGKEDAFKTASLREFELAVFEKKLNKFGYEAAQVHEPSQSRFDDMEACILRAKLIHEEAKELCTALCDSEATLEDILKEICDLLYVTVGTAVILDFKNLSAAFNRVHQNNMDKINNGTFNDDGKLVKAADHPKVNLQDLA